MNPHIMDRRNFLSYCALAVGSALCAGHAQAENPASGKPNPPRPPGCCKGWQDTDDNGVCNRSEGGSKPCKKVKCPGNKANPEYAKLKAKGAPAGVCSQWASKDKKVCDLSQSAIPCTWAVCPAHKEAVAKKAS